MSLGVQQRKSFETPQVTCKLKKIPYINIACLDDDGNDHSGRAKAGLFPQDLAALRQHQGASASHIGCLDHGGAYPCRCTNEISHKI